MASRPIFIPTSDERQLVSEVLVEFKWFAGMAVSRAQLCIDSLHEASRLAGHAQRILEISSKSRTELGVQLSAFNLPLRVNGRTVSVEMAFQSSKVFRNGGPFVDILEMDSKAARRDPRLRESGPLESFRFGAETWELQPTTAFYDWLYLNALRQNADLSGQLSDFDAFTDIAFNPKKSLNCQARSAALFCALQFRGLFEECLADQAAFVEVLRRFPEYGPTP